MAALFETFVRTRGEKLYGPTPAAFRPATSARPCTSTRAGAWRLYPDLSHGHRGACDVVGDAKNQARD
jgi:hypothetical protein